MTGRFLTTISEDARLAQIPITAESASSFHHTKVITAVVDAPCGVLGAIQTALEATMTGHNMADAAIG